MEEIKFRIWDKQIREMLPMDDDFALTLDGKHLIERDGEIVNTRTGEESLWGWEGTSGMKFKDRFILLQFTRRLDKNDVEIYKGDIVKAVAEKKFANSSRIGEIVCNEGTDIGEWQVSPSKDSKIGLGIGWGGWKSLEVIGNVFENPELIK